MLEDIADYMVLAPLVSSALIALAIALWLNRRRLSPVRVAALRRTRRLA